MRVGVVAYELEGEPTGVGRYLAGLLSGVASIDPGWQWVLFFHGEPPSHPSRQRRASARYAEWPGFSCRFAGRSGRPWVWEQTGLPAQMRSEGLDLLFSPSYSLPPRTGLPGVVTLHDLSFEALPEEFGSRERWRRRLLARRAARSAARVLVDTGRVAEEVADRYGLSRERIGVVPLGVEAARSDGSGEAAALARLGITRPYLLFVGSLFERRQPRLMLEVYEALTRERPGLTLVLAGANRLRRPADFTRWIEQMGAGSRVRLLGYVPEEALGSLYREAELSLYLSTYEGFGLPPLESLAHGTVAVVGPGTALDELWPEYPYRAAGLDLASVLAVAERALDAPEERRRVAAEGAARMAGMTWRRAAEVFLVELEKARSQESGSGLR